SEEPQPAKQESTRQSTSSKANFFLIFFLPIKNVHLHFMQILKVYFECIEFSQNKIWRAIWIIFPQVSSASDYTVILAYKILAVNR
ncbi:MAG: hypothetical protein R3Y18_05810, partial [Bacillota bacterium]